MIMNVISRDIIDVTKTCFHYEITDKRHLHNCYHGGECKTKFVAINETDSQEIFFCECKKVN
jgi:hypothetical protein